MKEKASARVLRALADLLWERDQRQMQAMDKLLAGSGPPRETSTRASKALGLLHTIRHAKRPHALEEAAGEFVRLLETIPDCAPHELSNEAIAFLERVAEAVIAEIERRVKLGTNADAVRLNLATAVYRIRRALEEIDRWHRHYSGALA
jgi:hypothetical protein